MALPFLGLNHLFIQPNKEPSLQHEGQIDIVPPNVLKLANKRSSKSRSSPRKYAAKVHPVPFPIPQDSNNSNDMINNNPLHIHNKSNNSNNSETSDDDSESSSHSFSTSDIYNNNNNIEMYLTLTRHRDEAIKKTHFLENKLKEQDVAYALKFDQFTHQIKQYKCTNYRLKTENINLRNELQILKNKLDYELSYMNGMEEIEHKYNNENNFELLLQKREKLANPKPQVPKFIQKEYKKESHTNIVCSMEEQFIYNNKLPSIKPPNSHIRQLTTIMEHKQIPLGLLMSPNGHMSHIHHPYTDGNINTKGLWENNNTKQRSITYV